MPNSDRPNPLGAVASKVGVAWSAAAGVVTTLLSLGVLTAAQADALTAAGNQAQETITVLGSVIGGVMVLVGGIVASFRTASAGRDEVTPITDPRTADGTPLIPAPRTPTVTPEISDDPADSMTDPFGHAPIDAAGAVNLDAEAPTQS